MPAQSVSIVVPTYKEAKNLPLLTERIFTALKGANIDGELIIVDDNSPDETQSVVADLEKRFPIRLIVRTNERGLSSAVIRGLDESRFDTLLCMDADLSHPPESIPLLVQPIESGSADFVIGSRYTSGGRTTEDWGRFRQLNSRVATLLARPLTSVRDPMAGFFCLARKTYETAKHEGLSPIGYKIGLELLIKARCRNIVEVPIQFSDRLHGQSKLTFRQQIHYLRHLVRLYRFKKPVSLVVAGSLILLAAAGLTLRFFHP